MIRLCLLLVIAIQISTAHAQERSGRTATVFNIWPEPPVAGTCEQDFAPLPSEAEKLELLLNLARDQRAYDLSCKLIDKLIAAETRMMVFFGASWPECVGALNTLNNKHATTLRARSIECADAADEPPRFFSLKEYKPRKSNLIGDFPRLRQ
jgi:hypothetical protein